MLWLYLYIMLSVFLEPYCTYTCAFLHFALNISSKYSVLYIEIIIDVSLMSFILYMRVFVVLIFFVNLLILFATI